MIFMLHCRVNPGQSARLAEFRARFAHLAPAGLSPRRRIDRSVALAEIADLIQKWLLDKGLAQ